jgi:hypothetical protein
MLTMWLDIETPDSAKSSGTAYKKWDIEPEPDQDLQVRISVYHCINLPNMDIEGTSDAYITVSIDDENETTTDTHWRCSDGKASFNYRLLNKVKYPKKKTELRIQAFDKDILSDDKICEWKLDITTLVNDCGISGKPIHLNKKYFDRMMLQTRCTWDKIDKETPGTPTFITK